MTILKRRRKAKELFGPNTILKMYDLVGGPRYYRVGWDRFGDRTCVMWLGGFRGSWHSAFKAAQRNIKAAGTLEERDIRYACLADALTYRNTVPPGGENDRPIR